MPETSPPGTSPNDSVAKNESDPETVSPVDEEKVQLEETDATAEANQVSAEATTSLEQTSAESQVTETTKEHSADTTSSRQSRLHVYSIQFLTWLD